MAAAASPSFVAKLTVVKLNDKGQQHSKETGKSKVKVNLTRDENNVLCLVTTLNGVSPTCSCCVLEISFRSLMPDAP